MDQIVLGLDIYMPKRRPLMKVRIAMYLTILRRTY